TMGTDWQGCQHAYAAQLAQLPDEASRARFLVSLSLQYAIQHPLTLAHSLLKNVIAFVAAIPSLVPGRFELPLPIKIVALPLFVPGLFLAWRRMGRAERLFWIAVFASVTLSAALIFADDGWRALSVTHIYLACAIAFAFVAPGVPASERAAHASVALERRQLRNILVAVAAVAALFILVPVLARAEATREKAALMATGDEQIVFGGRQLTGFLVIADGAPRPLSTPALTLSEFAAIWEWQGPDLGPLDDNLRRHVPFAVVFGLRPTDGNGAIYVAPPQVLERRDIPVWRFKIEPTSSQERWQSSLSPVAAADPAP